MKTRWFRCLSVLLSAVLLFSLCAVSLTGCSEKNAATELAVVQPTLPEAVRSPGENASDEEYDAWQTYSETRLAAAKGNTKAMRAFYKKTLAQVLGASDAAKKDAEENAVYSPVNVYLALAMLAETTDGDSRQQILDLLGEKDLSALRKRVGNLFTANYQDDGVATTLLANSLWMNESVQYTQKTVDAIAEKHMASVFSGKPGTPEMDKALHSWINEQTKDLLKEQAESLTLDPATVLALVSTLYLKAPWADPFEEANTKQETFYAPAGEKTVDMMHTSETMGYYSGDAFEAVAVPLKNSGYMWFFLPKKGSTAGDLTADKQVLKLLTAPDSYKNFSYPQVNLTLPKMDAVSDRDLIDDLLALGVTDVFDAAKSNFSPLMKDADGIFVSQVKHAARVKTDEEGVEAAAFTAILLEKASMPIDFVDFTVDRPFFFAVTGYTGDLLFTGVINDPAPQA